jgi:hypothetical protein
VILIKKLQIEKKIGGTIYRVNAFFNEESGETFSDKVLRLAQKDLTFGEVCGKLCLPQTGRLPERDSA